MRNEKKKTCLDCLHCKVSAKSTKNLRLCFCAKGNKAEKRMGPYYTVTHGSKSTQMGRPLDRPGNTFFQGASYMIKGNTLFILFESPNGIQCVLVTFLATKEVAQQDYDISVNGGFDVLGPFDAGSTDASRKAALQRILNAVQVYSKNPENPPKTW